MKKYLLTSLLGLFGFVGAFASADYIFQWAVDWETYWESDLSWIITWLNSTITEFIPYLVYLGLWIITVIIWFVAIRWLINRTQAKIRWTFSSWRRRR